MSNAALRLPRVLQKTGYSRSSILLKVREGSFPAPFRLGPNSVAWSEREVDEWLAARVAQRDAGVDERPVRKGVAKGARVQKGASR